MQTKYVTAGTARLTLNGKPAKTAPLIWGDEVEVLGAPREGVVPVRFRGRPWELAEKHLGDTAVLEIYFIDVGQGDSTFIVTPGRKRILIDGGENDKALRFLAWKYRLHEKVDGKEPVIDIDLLVLTHADGDHLKGLTHVVSDPRIRVRQIIHSGIAKYTDSRLGVTVSSEERKYLVTSHSDISKIAGTKDLSREFAAWAEAVAQRNVPSSSVFLGSPDLDIGDPSVKLEVLGPCLSKVPGVEGPAYLWFDGNGKVKTSKTVNGHSVVLRLTYDKVSILLTGDVNSESEANLLSVVTPPTRFAAHVMKAPHHGSHDFDPDFLSAVRPQVSVISSGDDRDFGHPRAIFLGAIGKSSRGRSPLLFSTEIAANFVEDKSGRGTLENAGSTSAKQPPPKTMKAAHMQFKRRLHGMINVRTDGTNIFSARRIAGNPPWETYFQPQEP